ncbi:ABC transporter substrate-binding protein [Oribacterium sinus]|uniref:ABC transporter substrate-binding protein n=1 Tax=Oribacterium sinus TaxID=237576 RepID=UPI0028EF22E5|nr:ABC transporter substrate-binding protein [Oribacterium sinus]
MKRNLWKWLLLCLLCLGLFACTKGGESSTEAKKESTPAVEEKSSSVESSENAEESKAENETETGEGPTILSLKGPTTIGLVHLMEKSEEEKLPYQFQMEASPDALLPDFVAGKGQIATVPANMAAVLYQKLDKDVEVLNINTLGILYVITGNEEVNSIADLAGKDIYMPGQGATPEYVLRALLSKNNVEGNLNFVTEPAEAVAHLQVNPNDVAILPEPFATATLLQNSNLQRKISITEEWKKSFDGVELPTAVTIVRKSYAKEHPEIVKAFLDEEKESIAAVEKDVQKTAELVVKQGILEKEALAAKAIPNCNIHFIDGEEMKKALEQYYQVLFASNPKSVGGALPEEGFYAEP